LTPGLIGSHHAGRPPRPYRLALSASCWEWTTSAHDTDAFNGERTSHTEGIPGDIYAEAQSRFNNAVSLKKLINLIDEIEWTSLGVDVKAAAYEGLLEKPASEGKKGTGQYFTPRMLIQSIVPTVAKKTAVTPRSNRPLATAAGAHRG
jgi:hypothetical protein